MQVQIQGGPGGSDPLFHKYCRNEWKWEILGSQPPLIVIKIIRQIKKKKKEAKGKMDCSVVC